jgi:hypothetical protein
MAAVEFLSGLPAVTFECHGDYYEALLWRNTDTYGSFPVMVYIHESIRSDENQVRAALNLSHLYVECHLLRVGEPSADPSLYGSPEMIAKILNAMEFPAERDTTYCPQPEPSTQFEMLNYYTPDGFSDYKLDWELNEGDVAGCIIWRDIDGVKVAQLWDETLRGNLMACAFNIFRQYCQDNDLNIDDYTFSPYIR